MAKHLLTLAHPSPLEYALSWIRFCLQGAIAMINLSQLDTVSPGRIHTLFGLSPAALPVLLETILPELLKRRRQVQENRPNRQRVVGGVVHGD